MPHRTQDSRLLAQVLKLDKEYSAALNGLLSSSQASLTALNAYASSCPPNHAQAMLGVVSALSGADEALKAYALSVDAWRADLKRIRRSEEEVANVLRDREILVGKLVKASHKRSTRDSTGLAASFAAETPLGLSSHASGTGSTVTLTGGTAKLNHAQAELQACELHLAAKEKELESTREEAIKKGLERRLKALVSCGWAWGERGKQALRALDVFGGEHTNGGPEKSLPSARFDPNDSQLSSVTPSQSASQIALPGASDDSPARPSTKPRGSSSSPLQTRAPEVKPEPTFALEIGPAHSIDDHGQIHESVPSSRLVDRPAPKVGENRDDSILKMPLEVHENHPFGNRKLTRDTGKPSVRAPNESSGRTLRRPAPADERVHASPRGVGFPRISSGSSQNKHASDLGPRNRYESPPRSPREEGLNRHGSLARKRSTSFSLLGGFTGMFRGKKRSSSAERNYMPMSTGGWHTRTDNNLVHSRKGRNSSSEDDLPSTLMRKSHLTEQTTDNGSITGGPKRLIKRMSTQASSRSKASPSQETEGGAKYTVIERPPREELVRRGSHSKRAANLSIESKETARETAANTAVNSGATSSRRASMPPERPSWDTTSQGSTIRNRLQHDNGTSGLNALESRTAELSKLSERLKRLEETDALMRTAGGRDDAPSMTLPPANLEVVKAPPSVTQAPLLLYPASSQSYGEERSATPRVSNFKFPAEPPGASSGSPARRPVRLGSLDSYTPQNGGSNLKPRPSTSSSKDAPLKSALKSPNRATAPLPALPSILVNNHKRSQSLAGDTLVLPDRSGTISPPTPAGAHEGLKANGDSLFVPTSNASNGSRTPPVTSSILVPTPRRLSEIPASARSSMAVMDDDESVYESAEEELGGIEEGEEGKRSDGTDTPPAAAAAGGALSNIFGRLRHEEPGTITPSRSTPVSIGEGSHEGSNVNASASTSSASTQRRKSVRMIIYPTVALSPPERYADEQFTPRTEDLPPPPVSPATTSASSSTIRQVHTTHGNGGGGGEPEAWETRIDSSKNAWDDSSEEDEEYGRAKRALSRASEPYSGEKRARRA